MTNEILAERMSNLTEALGANTRALTEFNSRLMKVEAHLYNDSNTGNDGLVSRVTECEKRISELKENQRLLTGKLAAMATIAGVVVSAIIKVVEHFLK